MDTLKNFLASDSGFVEIYHGQENNPEGFVAYAMVKHKGNAALVNYGLGDSIEGALLDLDKELAKDL